MSFEALNPEVPVVTPALIMGVEREKQIESLERLKQVFSEMVTADETELLSYTCYELTNALGKPLNAFSFVYRNNGEVCCTIVLQGTDGKILAHINDFGINQTIPWNSSHVLETIERGRRNSIPIQLVHLHVLQRIADNFGEQIHLSLDNSNLVALGRLREASLLPTSSLEELDRLFTNLLLVEAEQIRFKNLYKKLGFDDDETPRAIHPSGETQRMNGIESVTLERCPQGAGGRVVGIPVHKTYIPNDQRGALLRRGKAHASQILRTIERQLQDPAS